MPSRIYTIATGIIFLGIFALHLLRLIYRWPADFAGIGIPPWVSWVAMIGAGYLSAVGFRLSRKK